MDKPKAVVAIYDTTSYAILGELAEELKDDFTVEYLILDELLVSNNPDKAGDFPKDELKPSRSGLDYVSNDYLWKLNKFSSPRPITVEIVQRIIEDKVSPELSYNVQDFIDDTELDVFICGHDLFPFVKHIIRESNKKEFNSVVVQHGMNHPALVSSNNSGREWLTPTQDHNSKILEYIKRRVGYQNGAFLFANPYLDEVYTFGDYFSNHIRDLRSSYPCFGKADVISAGPTEYDPTSIQDYSASIDSALFLSQWQLESGEWDEKQQKWVVDRLQKLEEHSELELVIRPHPREKVEKIQRFYSEFEVSQNRSLDEDILEHDFIITYDSTALLKGVLSGKVCGVLDVPWDNSEFPPLDDDFLIKIGKDKVNLEEEAKSRNIRDQHNYLSNYCYVPALDSATPADSPIELVINRIKDLVGN